MSRPRLLLLSNSTNAGSKFLEHAQEQIGRFLGPNIKRAVFIPFAAVRFSYDDYAARVRAAFSALECEIHSVHEGPDPAAEIRTAHAIVVGGGNTFHLLRELYQRELLEAIRARAVGGVPYLGWSAGANLACPTIRTTNDMPIVEPPSLAALHLIPFQINPHYTDARLEGHGGETRDERLAEFLAVNPTVKVVGLREGTLLRVEGDTIELLGDKPVRIFTHQTEPREYAPGESLKFLLR